MTRKITRRSFIKNGTGCAMSLSAMLAAGPAINVRGANDKIVIGCIGVGGRGLLDMRVLRGFEDAEIGAVCDVYRPHLDRALDATGGKARSYLDYRKLLEQKDLDAVSIGTPDHWHALTMIHSCQAGKHVHVEKPISLTIREGRMMVKAAQKYDRVVLVGAEFLSAPHFKQAIEIIRRGDIGKITEVHCWNFDNIAPEGIGNPPDTDPPEELDWDLWLGPAPKVPYNPNRCIYNFRYFWDYSGGQLTDWGVHYFGIIHAALDCDAPLSANVYGGKYGVSDNRETPDTIEAVWEYPGGVLVKYSYRLCNGHSPNGREHGIEFNGINGTLIVNMDGFEILPERKKGSKTEYRMEAQKVIGKTIEEPHLRHFLDCIKTGAQPVCDIERGHRATSAPQIGNLSYHTRQRVVWDREKERVINVEEANRLLSKEYREPWKLEV
ncbi:MAG TPA: Gfo/Idh/MocA family oxidoreductase [bacterium]|nr:Gfo/Idh/MocA family oxidoreductase [bacterium]HQL63860.1 Gfo/Idh/MocA family oxidoreductase [bacterium]